MTVATSSVVTPATCGCGCHYNGSAAHCVWCSGAATETKADIVACPKCGGGPLHYVAENGVEVAKDCGACCPITKMPPDPNRGGQE